MHPSQNRHAFTLIELSIVLVIIVLVVGGIVAGRELIKNAEYKKLMSDVDMFNTAVNAFKLKYNCLPGDCTKATQFFGTNPDWDCSNDLSAPVSVVPRGESCNGNGNGDLNDYNLNGVQLEQYFFSQHLGSAGLINGKYSGYYGTPYDKVYPASSYSKGILWGVVQGAGEIYHITGASISKQILLLANSTDLNFALFTPRELRAIDNKFDDGKAASGIIQGLDSGYTNSSCYAGSGASTEYSASFTQAACSPLFKLNGY